jgi:hypothetical protein
MNAPQSVQVDLAGLVTKIEQIAASSNNSFQGLRAVHDLLLAVRDLMLRGITDEVIRTHPNPLNRHGRQCFSQSDEDGLTLEIVRRLGIEAGTFAEFGVGDGLENNTLILAALGWKGFWIGGEALAFDAARTARLRFTQARIDLTNIVTLATDSMRWLGQPQLDVISLDLDGNDIYFVRALLEAGFSPRLFVVEYNAKFPPPLRFQIVYNAQHVWAGDDYFGASLTSYAELFAEFGYRLVCTNAHTGANAFFVRGEDVHLFEDVPSDIDALYTPPRYQHYARFGHKRSAKVVEVLLSS